MNILKVARAKKSLSQKDTAKLLGMTRQQYIKYEHREVNPNVNMLNKLSKVLDVQVSELHQFYTKKGE
jgi:transcriptional regulator with XRE-family HTH domain